MIRLEGTVLTYNQPAWFRGSAEVILPGALDEWLRAYQNGMEIPAKLEHGRSLGIPILRNTDRGLQLELTTHPMPDILKVYNKIKQNDYVGGSFNYDPNRSVRSKNAQGVWEFSKLWLTEVTITEKPVYPSTNIYTRSWLTEDPYNIEGDHGELYVDPRASDSPATMSTSDHYMYTCVSCGETQDMEWGSLKIPISASDSSDDTSREHPSNIDNPRENSTGDPMSSDHVTFKANYVNQLPREKRLDELEARTKSVMERINQINIY